MAHPKVSAAVTACQRLLAPDLLVRKSKPLVDFFRLGNFGQVFPAYAAVAGGNATLGMMASTQKNA